MRPDVGFKTTLKRALAGLIRRIRPANGPDWDQSLACIDEFDGQKIRGWFIARYPDAQSNKFELVADGTRIGEFEADQPRDDVFEIHGIRNCGFELLLEASASSIRIRSLKGKKVAEFSGSAKQPGSRPVSRIERALHASTAIGCLDQLDVAGCSGWAGDTAKPASPVMLELLVDGECIHRFSTVDKRSDLAATGISGDKAGFSLNWPAGLFSSGARIDVRHISSGKSLAHSPMPVPDSISVPNPGMFHDWSQAGKLRPVTVVIPVFDALTDASECIEAVARTLPIKAEILIIDDASTDPGIEDLLARWRGHPACSVIQNRRNLGYTRTVNRATLECPDRDIVLLNSDTIVSDRWLQNLRFCAYHASKVATVTPLSNNAGAFSVPRINTENPIPDSMDLKGFSRTIAASGSGRKIEIPTGNGFCLYIRRDALDELGEFDAVRFPVGYGEENDFCMRALRKGWTNLLCDKAVVLHKRSKSFGDRREALARQGAETIRESYPEYSRLIRRFDDVEFSTIRSRSEKALASGSALPRLLFVISSQTGGVPQTNLDLMRALGGRFECFLLSCDSLTLTLSQMAEGELCQIEKQCLPARIDPITHRSQDYDRVVSQWMYQYGITLIHVRHLGWHSLGIMDAAESLEIPLVFSVHDFYSICPSLKLLDERGKFCGGTCTMGEGTCQIELWQPSQIPALKHRFVDRWQAMFAEALDKASAFVTTAQPAADQFLKRYPGYSTRMHVVPHGRDIVTANPVRNDQKSRGKFRILVLGNMTLAKGGELMREIIDLDAGQNFEFHFLGQVSGSLASVGIQHGEYERDSVVSRIKAINPDLGLVLSVWPETWCHTLTEMWAGGVPVLGLDIGAVGQRIRDSGAGWLLPVDADASRIYDRISEICRDDEACMSGLEAVERWQQGSGLTNTTSRMADRYHDLYSECLSDALRSDHAHSPASK